MRRYTVAQIRARLAEALDWAERGHPVLVERRGVRFRLESLRPRRRAKPDLIASVDAAVEAGCWSWEWEKVLSVAEAKRRFSELIERVQHGERIIVSRRGRPAVALVAAAAWHGKPVGLAAVAGALAVWPDLEAVVAQLYAARRRARDRWAPRVE